MKNIIWILFLLAGTLAAEQRTSVTRFGVTWTFDQAYECGQFVNGDWWVKGPVSVQSVSPEPTGTRNGSMVNPGINVQAYDDRIAKFTPDSAVSFPLALQPDQSLVSAVSNPETSNCMAGPHAGWESYDGNCYLGRMDHASVLTCVAAEKPAGTFRPPYNGSAYRPYFSDADINWGLLPMLPATVNNTPEAADILRAFERPWIDHFTGWSGRYLHPSNALPDYGREIGNLVSKGAVYLMSDAPAVDTLAIRYIQLGIDNYGIVMAGGAWGVDGGHLNGRKWPTVFAGLMLGDSSMAAPGLYANEDGQTYYGAATPEYPDGKPMWGIDCGGRYTDNYEYDSTDGCWDLKSGASGNKACRDPEGLREPCAYRICCTSPTWVGEALAGRIMQAEDEWGNDAFFDYVDRWVAEEGIGKTFINEMWQAYRDTVITTGIAGMSAFKRGLSVWPNPANGMVTFRGIQNGTVKIYDPAGRIISGAIGTGRDLSRNTMVWNGTDQSGNTVSPGLYFYTITTESGQYHGRIMRTE